MKKPDEERLKHLLTRNVSEVIDRASLMERLRSGKKLRIKFGADPTAPDLHLGHTIALRKLRDFQDLGHKVIFIIGDFTARIGDPSGRSSVKKALSQAEIARNAKTYFRQVGAILDVKKAEIRFNSQWLSRLDAAAILRLTSQFTISRILERDDFQKRLKGGTEVWMHETLYPLMQAYDSVAVKADVELGGTDQLFNFLVARHLQERLGGVPQDIMTFDLLVGLDGKEKMSKSLGNYIGISEGSASMFGKVMSLPDEQILSYFRLATRRTDKEIDEISRRLKDGENPRDIKLDLARDIVALYHSRDAAERAFAEFVRVFSKKELPQTVEEVALAPGTYEVQALITSLKLARSRSEAWRLVSQGAVEIIPRHGLAQRMSDPRALVRIENGTVVKVGKKQFVRTISP